MDLSKLEKHMKLSKANLDFLDDLFEKLLNDDETNGGDGSDSIDNTSDAPSAESRDT
jgi:hypothetical protein